MNIEEFLFAENGNNHRPLMWLALELTKGSKLPVGEFGSGHGSTTWLRHYCKDDGREFYSYDNNPEWGDQFGSQYTSNWDDPRLYRDSSVVLIDQGPADARKDSIRFLVNKADIIVVHDAEEEPNNNYHLHEIWHLFKYRVRLKGPKIWTAALSKKIDLTKYANTFVGEFKIEL
jgi:hypothetical protein